MRFCEVLIELVSPAVLASRRTERGYLSPLSYIPATTLRGAILSSLYYSGILDEDYLRSESDFPSVFTSPAYPLTNNGKSYPCHPFAYRCKLPHNGKYESKIYAHEVIDALELNVTPRFRHTCGLGHIACLEEVHPSPVIPKGETFEKVSLTYEHVICVGMSSARAASRRQLLYEYEALAAGQRFWFRLAAPDEIVKGLEKDVELCIGRGISRGFGRARILEVRSASLGELGERVRQIYSDKRFIALYSISHLIPTHERQNCLIEVGLGDVGNRCGVNASGKILVKKIYGRCGSLQLGWDMLRGRRPVISPAWKPGSIAIAEFKDLEGAWGEAVAALAYIGTPEILLDKAGRPWPIVGVNVMEPLRLSPMLGEVR